jgi:hypothetical protein
MNNPKSLLLVLFTFFFLNTQKSWSQPGMIWDSNGPTNWVNHLNSLNPASSEGQIVIELTGSGGQVRTWNVSGQSTTVPPASPCATVTVGQEGTETPFACGKLSAHITTVGINQQLIIKGVSSNLPRNGESFSITVTVIKGLNVGDPSFSGSYTLVLRKPHDLVFVLDRSGSMECSPTAATASTGWPGCITDATKRWNMLKDGVENFLNKIHDFEKLPSDRMSVVYFSGDAALNGNLSNNEMLPFSPISTFMGTPNPLKLEMGNSPIRPLTAPPSIPGGTSVGAGLLKGFDRFTHDVHDSRKTLIIFTDGEQNTGNWVVESGADAGKIIKADNSAAAATLLNMRTNTAIERYALALVVPSSGATLVSNIVNDSNTQYLNVMPGQELNFAEQMGTLVFNAVYGANSPQLIRYDKQSLTSSGSVSSSFNCNKDVNRVIFEAYFDEPIGKRVRHKVFKDGVDVTAKGTPLSMNEHISSIAFNLYNIRDLKSEGKWTFEILGNPDSARSSKLRLFATADDHQVKFIGQLSKGKIRVKEVIKPIATVFEQDKAVTNATVKAVILKPGDDIGDILARTTGNVPTPSGKEYSNCGDRKYDYLQATNPAALTQLKNIQSTTISLTHQGNGVYTGNYNDVDVSGTYKVQYIVNYTSPTLGEVERLIEQTVNVTFPELDWALTVPKKISQSTSDNVNRFTATIRPAFTVNGKTRYVGPGYGNAFSVNNHNVSLYNVNDNCDGTYELSLSGSLTERIDLYLTDKVIYSGRAIDLTTGARGFGLSAHAGLAIPTNNFTTLVKTGYYGELDLTYRFTSRFSLDAVGGYYAFSPNYNILAGTLNAVVQFPFTNNWEAHLGLGWGLYKPQSLTAKNGIAIRASIGKLVKQRYFISLDVAKHQVKDYDIDFVTAGLGLKFYF